jgi:hypothetical protein
MSAQFVCPGENSRKNQCEIADRDIVSSMLTGRLLVVKICDSGFMSTDRECATSFGKTEDDIHVIIHFWVCTHSLLVPVSHQDLQSIRRELNFSGHSHSGSLLILSLYAIP